MPRALYRAFGLNIEAEMELPELPIAPDKAVADLEVCFGDAPATVDGGTAIETGVTAAPGILLIDSKPARYLVREGREIFVAPKTGASARDIRAYVLGSAIGAVLHQRGILPLHANAVVIDGQAVAFAGFAGAGKSTLADHFRRRGRSVLCDDVCAITFDRAGKALAWPGIPRIKLWGDALAAFGRTARGFDRVLDGEDKFSLPFQAHPLAGPVKLGRIYMLTRAETEKAAAAVWPLTGFGAYAAINANTYRREFAAPLGMAGALFANVMSLLNSTPLFQVERRWGFDVFDEEVAAIEAHLAGEKTRLVGSET